MTSRRAVNEIVNRVRDESRRQLVRYVVSTEADLDRAWAPILERLKMRLRNARPAQVQIIIDEATRELGRIAVEHVSRAIRQTSEMGAVRAEQQHVALTGPTGPMHDPSAVLIAARISEQRERFLAAARITGQFAPDRVPLSSRLYRNMDEVGRSAGRVVRSSIEAREGIFQTAERFIAENATEMRIPVPRYAEEIAAAARRALETGDRRELLDTIDRHVRQMERLGEGAGRRDGLTSLRSAVRQFVNDVQRATPRNIDRIVQRHIADRAQFQARRIARHETVEAHRQSYIASVEEQPYTKGLRWTLSGSHPTEDVCDLYANQAIDGMGPGGYTRDDYPETPHPNCLCVPTAILDESHFRRQLAQQRGEPEPPRSWEDPRRETATDWLARQPAAARQRLLGPTRARIFDQSASDRSRVIDDRGNPIPVHQVLGTEPRSQSSVTVPLRRTGT
jgi:hypothetical protein